MMEGREERSLFLDRSMIESDVEEGMSSGIPQVRLLLANSNLCSFTSFPRTT